MIPDLIEEYFWGVYAFAIVVFLSAALTIVRRRVWRARQGLQMALLSSEDGEVRDQVCRCL